MKEKNKVTFTGDKKHIENIIKENRLRVSRGYVEIDFSKDENETRKKRTRRTKDEIEADKLDTKK